MRKKVLSSVFALALLATAGWGVNKSMSNDAGLSDLALANVEALAQGEVTFPWLCMQTTPDHCITEDGYEYTGERVW